MSFRADLLALLAADLVTAGIVSKADQVYVGRRARKITDTEIEVWLEHEARESVAPSGLQNAWLYSVVAHVRRRLNGGPDSAGGDQVATVEAKTTALADRYDGRRPFAGDASMADLVAVEAEETVMDSDAEDETVLDAAVRLKFLVRG